MAAKKRHSEIHSLGKLGNLRLKGRSAGSQDDIALHLKKDARPGLPRPLSMPHDPVEPLSPRLDESLLQSVISGADHSLVYVKVTGATNLRAADANGTSDPYANVRVANNNVFTATIYNTVNPTWNHECSFPLRSRHDFLVIHVWDEDLVGSDDFLGEIRVPLTEYGVDKLHKKSFKLERGRGKYKNVSVTGEIQIQFLYRLVETETMVQRADIEAKYSEVVKAIVAEDFHVTSYLLDYVEAHDLTSTPEGEGLLYSLLTIYQNHSFAATMRLLTHVIEKEVNNTSGISNLFRKNTPAPKLLARYALSVGQSYLKELLSPLITNIIKTRKTYEIDPKRLKTPKLLERNTENVRKKCQKFLDAIMESSSDVPRHILYVAKILRDTVAKRSVAAVRNSLASFYFLRFVCPAIVAPEHYKIISQSPKDKSRFLLLIAKVLQRLANSADSGSSAKVSVREQYMESLSPFLEENRQRVHEFLFKLSEDDSKSDVLPGFENLDSRQYGRALTTLHGFLSRHEEKMLEPVHTLKSKEKSRERSAIRQAAHESPVGAATRITSPKTATRMSAKGASASLSLKSAPTLSLRVPDVLSPSSPLKKLMDTLNSEKVQAILDFELVVERLGPPRKSSGALSLAVLESHPESERFHRHKSNLFNRMKNRFYASQQHNSIVKTKPKRRSASSWAEEYKALEQRLQQAVVNHAEITDTMEHDMRRLRNDFTYLTAYVGVLENELRKHTIPLPARPPRPKPDVEDELHSPYSISGSAPRSPTASVSVTREARLSTIPASPSRTSELSEQVGDDDDDDHVADPVSSVSAASGVADVELSKSQRTAVEEKILAQSSDMPTPRGAKARAAARRMGRKLKPPVVGAELSADEVNGVEVRTRSNSIMLSDLRRQKSLRRRNNPKELKRTVYQLRTANHTLRARLQLQELQLMQWRHLNRRKEQNTDDESESSEDIDEELMALSRSRLARGSLMRANNASPSYTARRRAPDSAGTNSDTD